MVGLDRVVLLMATGHAAALSTVKVCWSSPPTGLAGRLAGQVALVLPAGVSATGFLAWRSTPPRSPSTTVEVAPVAALSLPGGPYLRFEATGFLLSVWARGDRRRRLREGRPPPTTHRPPKWPAATSPFDLAGVLRPRDGTALLLVTGAGLARFRSRYLSLTVPGVTSAGR